MTRSLQYRYGGEVVQIGRTIAAARDAMAMPGNVIPLTRFDTAERPKISPGNSTFAPMLIDADPADYHHQPADTGIEHVTTRQMAAACAVLFVAIIAVSFGPWGL